MLRYPVDPLTRGIEGEADIYCTVTAQGDTKDCVPIRTIGALEFKDAALRFVRGAKYHPAVRNGVPEADAETDCAMIDTLDPKHTVVRAPTA